MREILDDAVFYVVRGGCAWRLLPHDFPPRKTVYHCFRAWRIDGTWRRLHEEALRRRARVRLERDPQPSAGIVDSQSAKTTGVGGRGGARLRPRQEGGPGPQAAPAGGHRRAGDEGEGPLGRRLGPGRHQAADGARDGALPAALASVAGRRIQRQGEGGKDWAEEALGLTVEVVRPPRRWVFWVPADQEPPPRPAFTVLARRGGWWREHSRGWDRTAG